MLQSHWGKGLAPQGEMTLLQINSNNASREGSPSAHLSSLSLPHTLASQGFEKSLSPDWCASGG